MKKCTAIRPRRNASILKLRRKQRILVREQIFMFAFFLEEWFWQTEEMKDNKQYKDPDFLMRRWQKMRYQVLGGPGYGHGLLQEIINLRMNDILTRLREDDPQLSEKDYYAYSYFVAGFNNRTVAHLVGLDSEKTASSLKSQLKDSFLRLNSPYKFEYLEVLPLMTARQLPIWQRNSIFACL